MSDPERHCENPDCPLHYQPVTLDDLPKLNVRYFLGAGGETVRLCTGCANVIALVAKNPYGIRPELFL